MVDSHTKAALYYIREDLLELTLVSLFYGIYFVLWVQATYLLILLITWTKRLLLLATFVMFVSATASWIEVIIDILLDLLHRTHPENTRPSSLTRKHNELVTANDVFVRVVYVLSDATVVQRAWALWPQNRNVKILLSGCILATIAGSAVDLALDLKNRWDGRALVLRGQSVVFTRALIMAVPTLLTNLCPTTLIAIKAWGHRAFIRKNLSEARSGTGLAERILVLLVECGVLYCITWVMYILTTADLFPGTVNKVLSRLLILLAFTYSSVSFKPASECTQPEDGHEMGSGSLE
ncbi:uncharacterized protein STEHIDRAFT_152140 [Stereum hirsutum FP-91666 SS1]|uniref:uncharacterized protein n=1 Tax=Stereum hirsutum (strain FP-91666) TaxID=721885 RepID=UPI000440A4C8|nr:uncharacterized protein STEHIDRAFT_152140 [Stereum hirsutum FP-91666 SS1]EIM92836.1 hypothetical protein STEHIDRAFT_152140 [Stereum hirsutum FP-91666 SS1]